MTSWPLFKNTFILRRSGVDNFTDIIRITAIFIKASFAVKRIRNVEIMY